jgi:nuclear pore complex protein Nup98-Nup96
MRIKDFSDRHPVAGDDSESDAGVEGHSEMADSVTCAYAAQLEALGHLQKAVFVLLHLEGGRG